MDGRSLVPICGLFVFLLVATGPAARQPTPPFRVMVTRLVQNTSIESDVSFGDFYANVEVNGVRDTNKTACSDVDVFGGIIYPVVLFDGFIAVDECSKSTDPKKWYRRGHRVDRPDGRRIREHGRRGLRGRDRTVRQGERESTLSPTATAAAGRSG